MVARLPNPGGDAGNWGNILNEYLSQSIDSAGGLKADVVGTPQLQDASVTSDKLASNTASNGQILSYNSGNLTWISPASGGAISVDDISDATAIGKAVLTADSAASARTYLGAGTSNLVIGVTSTTAKAGDYQPTAEQVSGLSTVATSGSYNDLSDRPTITPPPVTSVAGKTGIVTLVKADAGLGNVDNTSDTNKPVSTATQTALNLKANDNEVVKLTTDQTLAGVKTFSASPIVPSPTTTFQASTKAYADDSKTDIFNKLSPFYAAASGLRTTRPIIVAIAGASVAAQITSDRWTYQFNARLQATYPRGFTEQPIITLATAVASPPTGTGIVTVNAAIGGTVTSNYLTSTTRPQLMNLHPSIIIHADMPANDYGSKAVTPATVKANMITQLNALDALASPSYPYIHVVVGGYYPTITGALAPISEFRQALRESTEGRSNVLYIDAYDFFTSIGVGSGGADPLGLLLGDNLHPSARGHMVLADHVSRIFNLAQVQTYPPIITTGTLTITTDGIAFSQTIAATSATAVTWSVVSGSLPAGLSLVGSTGIISGTPTTAGAYTFTLRATNSYGSTDRAFTGSVNASAEPVATIITSDDFTTDGSVNGRTANAALGGATASWLASGTIFNTSAGRLVHNGTSSGVVQIAHADNTDVQVSATFTSYTSGNGTYIEVYRKASGTCYLLGVSSLGTLRLAKSDATVLQEYSIAPAAMVGKRYTIRYYNGKISAYEDGALLSEHDDTTVTRTGSGSGFSRLSGTISASWDNFVLESLA